MKIRSLVAALLLSAFQGPAHAAFANLNVLGDSLSDTGNLYQALFTASFGVFAVPDTPYQPGRFSNGPVWVDYFANAHPGIAINDTAVGGAFSGLLNGRDNAGDDDFAPLPLVGGLLASAATGLDSQLSLVPAALPANTAVVLWIGANDLNNAVSVGFASAQAVVPTSLANVSAAVDQLLASGAAEVFLGNLPDLGRTPGAAASGSQADLTAATLDFNNGLVNIATGLGGKVQVVDIFSSFNFLLANAGLFGFSDTTTPCVDGLFDSTACSDPASHLFWDNVHPTTSVHALVAGIFAAAIEAAPAPVPLPGSVWLLAPGLGLLLFRRRAARG